MRFLDTFFQRITTDFRQKELLPLKLLFFVHASTLYVLYPYLTIHMRELGINVEEAAIMSAVTPIVAIIMPPVAGVVADRIGNFKFLLSLFNALGGATSLLLLLVPVGRVTVDYPVQVLLDLQCSNHTQGRLALTLAEEHPCHLLPNLLQSRDESLPPATLPADLEACGLLCYRDPDAFAPAPEKRPATLAEESASILRTRSYTVVIHDRDSNVTDNYLYTLSADDLPLYRAPNLDDDDARNNRIMKNFGHFRTSVRQLTNNSYFFPTSGLYNFTCVRESESAANCSIDRTESGVPIRVESKSEKLRVKLRTVPGGVSGDETHFYIKNINMRWKHGAAVAVGGIPPSLDYFESMCTNEEPLLETEKVSVPLLNPENSLEVDSVLELNNCQPSCLLTLERNKFCSNPNKIVTYDIRLTFWLYLVIRVFIGMISGTAFAMFEGAVIAILREHKADYGLQRIYAAIGGMISSPLSGMLIDYASQNKGYTDFRPAFYLYAGLKIISGALMLTINLEFKSPATNVVADVMSVLRNIEIIALFITCFILGSAWGYIESFLFWLLQDLGASRSLMGITITIGGIAGLPLLVMSGPIIDKIGHADVLFIGFIFYAIRLLGYSLIYNPWMCLIFEAMESVTSSLAITAAVTYAAKLSTNTTDSSIQGLLGGLYFGVGKGTGSLIGGFLMKAVGTRPTYQIFSAMTLVTGCLYYLFNHFYIERRTQAKKELDKVNGMTGSGALEKEKAANATGANSLRKEGSHVVENIPLNASSANAKKYTNCDQSSATANGPDQRGGRKADSKPLASCHVNLAYANDDDEHHLRNRGQATDDTRNKEKR